MIIVYHHNDKIIAVEDAHSAKVQFNDKANFGQNLFALAKTYPDSLIIWCHNNLKETVDLKAIENLFYQPNLILSYSITAQCYFPAALGYIDQSPFINPNRKVRYPTWCMSSDIGGIHAITLNHLSGNYYSTDSIGYWLNSLAKRMMPLGLHCYSEPGLLKKNSDNVMSIQKASMKQLFKFAKQHYRARWVFMLFLNLMIYERRFPFFAIVSAFFAGKITDKNEIQKENQKSIKNQDGQSLDVVIPTLGRKQVLYDLLTDFKQQSQLPDRVIIVEQNPIQDSTSDLDYLNNEKWPFEIKHIYTNTSGACNARNLGIKEVQSDWVFLADDDLRIENDFVETLFKRINNAPQKAFTLRCYQKGEKSTVPDFIQWGTFGSGCSIVHNSIVKAISFDTRFEFGYGEDVDYGMQIRNLGEDIIYLNHPSILHLKAPFGGFRSKPVLAWQSETIQPKPSPTILLKYLLHNTEEQLFGYKSYLFIKLIDWRKLLNLIKFVKQFKQQWASSLYWANYLKHSK